MSSTSEKPTEEVLTLPEAAAYLRVPEEVLDQLAARQIVPARKLGEEWRFSRIALIKWLGGNE
jgi:excisionase family DNA binding protein